MGTSPHQDNASARFALAHLSTNASLRETSSLVGCARQILIATSLAHC